MKTQNVTPLQSRMGNLEVMEAGILGPHSPEH
jgi:hypothetical protein